MNSNIDEPSREWLNDLNYKVEPDLSEEVILDRYSELLNQNALKALTELVDEDKKDSIEDVLSIVLSKLINLGQNQISEENTHFQLVIPYSGTAYPRNLSLTITLLNEVFNPSEIPFSCFWTFNEYKNKILINFFIGPKSDQHFLVLAGEKKSRKNIVKIDFSTPEQLERAENIKIPDLSSVSFGAFLDHLSHSYIKI
jgi:hypothetical protein